MPSWPRSACNHPCLCWLLRIGSQGQVSTCPQAAASPEKRSSASKARTSQYNGVGRAHRKQEWQARIQVDGKVRQHTGATCQSSAGVKLQSSGRHGWMLP